MVRILTVVFLLILLIVGVSFSSLNSESVELNYYFGTKELPLSLSLVIAIGVGAIFGLLGSLGVIMRLKRQVMKLKKSVKSAEREASHLRATPAKDG